MTRLPLLTNPLVRAASALTSPSTSSSTTASLLLPALQSLSLGTGLPSSPCSSSRSLHTTPSRAWFWNRKSKASDPAASPLEKQLTGNADARKKLVENLQGRLQGPALFQDEAQPVDGSVEKPGTDADPKGKRRGAATSWGTSLTKEHISRAADPDPRSRVRWERKMVIRQIHRGTDAFSVEPRAERLARTERVLKSKSPYLPTSVKKLVHLARQVQGKTVAEALTQMRYSKKKMAREVRVQLEQARDLAVVERGMGIGLGADKHEGTVKIQTKNGKFVEIDDPTRMYVAEAWVNRGPLRGKRVEYRARGAANILKRPSTSKYPLYTSPPPICRGTVGGYSPAHLACFPCSAALQAC